MNQKVLVTYASLYGSTTEIARAIAEQLSTHLGKSSVELRRVDVIENLDDYSAVVLGGAIYGGEWAPAVNEFVDSHKAQLKEKALALFVVAIRLREDTESMRKSVLSNIETQRIMLEPIVSVGLFAGKVDYDALSPIVRMKAKTKGLPEGDFRNWDAIAAWADELVPHIKRIIT